MEIKIEYVQSLTLCDGCLSGDRKLIRVTGAKSILFCFLRGDVQPSNSELQLCWECAGMLHKLKVYQARIKTAQQRLTQYIQAHYQNEPPRTLSCLEINNYKPNYYNYELYDEDIKPKHSSPLPIVFDEDDEKIQKEPVLNDIKLETDDNDASNIKEEYFNDDDFANDHFTNDDFANNDTVVMEPDLKSESDEKAKLSTHKIKRKFNKNKKKNKNKIPLYEFEKYVTVTDKVSVNNSLTEKYYEIVYLSYVEYENFFARFRKKIGYKGMPFKCEECKLGYKRRLDLLRHNALQHDKTSFPHPCNVCKAPINSQTELAQHWQDAHTKMYQCIHCAELCVCKQQVTKHRKWAHTKIYTCNLCRSEFGTMRHFSEHYQKDHDRAICDYCGKSYFANSKRLLANHIKRTHLPGFCQTCNRQYKSLTAFEYHCRIFHPELVQQKVKKELCYCVECDLQFPSINRYERHLSESVKHTPRKKIRVCCPACDKTFAKRTTMNSHFKLFHSNESKHYCELCDKYFARAFGLRTHITRVHQKLRMPKDKMCDLCGRGFSTSRILENHRRTHTGERPFKCGYCPASFAQKYAMMTHQKKQHENLINMDFAIK